MNRLGRLVIVAGVGLLAAVGVTGVLAGAGGILGGGSSDDSPAAAQSGDVQTPDSLVGESGDTPDGETEPADDVNDDQGDGDDQGDDENDADGQEVAGDVIDCPSGEDTQFKFEQSDNEFEVTGLLVSLTATEVQVTGPDGVPGGNPVIAAVDPNAEVKGDLSAAGTPVKVEGSIVDGAFVAHEIEPACEDEDDFDDDGDEGDDANDDSSSSGDEVSGEDHGGHGEDEDDGGHAD